MPDDARPFDELLAEALGGQREDYQPDAPMPDPDDLEAVPAEEFECPCGCTEEADDA